MNTPRRTDGALVIGEAGPAVVLAGEVCNYIEHAADMRRIRERARLDDPDMYWALIELRRCALAWQTRAVAQPSPARHDQARERDTGALSGFVTANEAAALAGTTARTIQRAITAGQLPATDVGGRWLIAKKDLKEYRASTRPHSNRGK